MMPFTYRKFAPFNSLLCSKTRPVSQNTIDYEQNEDEFNFNLDISSVISDH